MAMSINLRLRFVLDELKVLKFMDQSSAMELPGKPVPSTSTADTAGVYPSQALHSGDTHGAICTSTIVGLHSLRQLDPRATGRDVISWR